MKKLMYIGLFLMITFSAFGWPHRINWGLPFLPMGIINDNFDEIFSRADTDSARIDGVVASDLLKVSLADSTGADAPGTYVTGHDNIAALALKANLASPTFTGTVTAPIFNVTGAANFALPVSVDSSVSMGEFGDASQTILSEASSNTNALLGVYPMVNFAASAGKVFAGTYNRLLAITTAQTNDVSMFGAEDQFRLKGVNLGTGVHAGLWAYAEQSGTSTLSGGAYFAGISAAVESASTFTVGATEHVNGIVVNSSINAGAAINASADFSGILINSSALEWKTGIKISGVDSIDIQFQNGATIDNEQSDTLRLTETAIAIRGNLNVVGDITSTQACCADYAITDYQPPLLDYWAKTKELNRLPAFEEIDRSNIVKYINGLEESNERLLRYVVEMEARLTELEKTSNRSVRK